MEKDTGGQAFPSVEETYIGDGQTIKNNIDGMTLRDYFAGQALNSQALAAALAVLYTKGDISATTNEELAEIAYDIADAMIKKRSE